VHPPHVLSSEKVENEVTWSLGEYMHGREVWKAFNLRGDPPAAIGVYANQPSSVATNVKSIWVTFALFAVFLLVLMAVFDVTARKETVFQGTYRFPTSDFQGEASFVTDPFDLNGGISDVQIKTSAGVYNSWIYLNYALINQDTGQAWDF